MGCRKSQSTLSSTERGKLVAAFLALKAAPSVAGTASRYDDFVQEHIESMAAGNAWAHRRPAFLPWHREYLRRFEQALQSHDPDVTLPYWDWTVDNSPASAIWGADFMGGDGAGPNDEVATGPFAGAAGDWPLTSGGNAALQRDLGGWPGVSTLPTAAQVDGCLDELPYDEPPWNDSPTLASFRNRLEGWFGSGSIHNRVHLWVGGSMLPESSPNDPVFWLHHCNIDRLWVEWRRRHPAEPYAPAAGGPAGHNLGDSMQPWGGTTTVASTLDHHAMGYWYDTDPAEVTLATPSLSFADVPEGLGGAPRTTYRAAVFEVRSCAPVTLSIVAGPSAGFATTLLGTAVNVPSAPGDAPAIGRLWIAYTTGAPGSSASGSVTIAEDGTANQWVISLTANTIARPRTAVALALDRSGSMSMDAGGGTTKVQKLKEAVGVFVDTMIEGDGLGLVGYDDVVDRHLDVTNVGPQPAAPGSGRAAAAALLAGSALDPRGLTGIGGAVLEAQDVLSDGQAAAATPYDNLALVVLTDGIENVPPMVASVLPTITAGTYAVGLGLPSGISVGPLDALAQATGKYLLVTGALTDDQRFRLSKYFLQILAGVTGAQVVVDPRGDLVLGPTHRIPIDVTPADNGLDVILCSPLAPAISFLLEAPDGTVLDPGSVPAGAFVPRPEVAYYRLPLPQGGPGSPLHAGRWHALLALGEKLLRKMLSDDRDRDRVLRELRRGSVAYNLVAHAYSTLTLHAQLAEAVVRPGEAARITATLDEYGVPVERRAAVWAEVASPVGAASTVPLAEVSPGAFAGQIPTFAPGLYPIRLRARGTALGGVPFTREAALSLVAQRRPEAPPGEGDGRGDAPWDLVECLLGHAKEGFMGLSPEEIRKCLESARPQPRRRPAREAVRPPGPPGPPRLPSDLPEPEIEPEPDLDRLRLAEPPRPPEPVRDVHPHVPGEPMFGLSPQDIEEEERRRRDGGGDGGGGGGGDDAPRRSRDPSDPGGGHDQ